eukprot:5523387-Prymnesium_polylepis.1
MDCPPSRRGLILGQVGARNPHGGIPEYSYSGAKDCLIVPDGTNRPGPRSLNLQQSRQRDDRE